MAVYLYDGTVLRVSTAIATHADCCCDCDEGEVQSIQVTGATLTGETGGSHEDCGEEPIEVSATCSAGPLCSPCVTSCSSASAPVEFTCPGDCWPEEECDILFTARLSKTGSDWHLIIDVAFGCLTICGGSVTILGGDEILDMNLGADPSGTHNLAFDDPNLATIHYTVDVEITA